MRGLPAIAVRVGIELSPVACRIIEIDGGAWWRRRSDTRVKSFSVLPPGGFETEAKLKSLRKAAAGVVVWGVPSDHRQVMVTDGSYERMRHEALESLAGVGLETGGVLADIASTPRQDDQVERRPVVVALAAAPLISAALAPLVAAGIEIHTVMTPPAALVSLGRLRRASAVPNAIEAYVALEETSTCIALLRDGALVTARELPWGFIDATVGHTHVRPREEIAERLGQELAVFFVGAGVQTSAVSQICVCGGLPELRSMTVGLMELLDIEVEPLDSLFGIDAARLPKRADEFRERSSELRLAWAAVADWHAKINLLRARRRQAAKVVLSRAAVVAGVAVGLGIGWAIERSQWWRSIAPESQKRSADVRPPAPLPQGPARTASPPAVPASPASPAPVAPAPQTTMSTPSPAPPALPAPQPVVPPAVAKVTPADPRPPAAAKVPAPPVGPSANQLPKPIPATPSPAPALSATREAASPMEAPAAPVARAETRPAQSAPPRAAVQPPAPRTLLSAPATAPAGRAAPPAAPKVEVALPFEATLGTILYSPDRKLAIIDGHIVGVGDEIRGARVTDITASAVFLRDAQGRLRRLALGAAGR